MLNEDSEPTHSGPIEILLVDDHSHARKLLREITETFDDLTIVGEAVNGEESGAACGQTQARCGGHGCSPARIEFIGLTAGDPHEDESYDHRWCGSGHQ